MTKYKVNLSTVKEVELIVEAESEDSIEQLLADGELFDKATSEEETFYGCSPWEIWQMEEA
tara:strand:+ start:455 stop:637 length:183 start_codon:yes stop_codon:yes gene_type:complete